MSSHEKKIIIPPEAVGMRLSDYLNTNGYEVSMDCGGHGTCGKCRVRLYSGVLNHALPDADGWILACQAICSSQGAEILLSEEMCTESVFPEQNRSLQSPPVPQKPLETSSYGIALDIGTTTLAAALVDLKNGKTVATLARLNPQRSFGADVMSRISAAENGFLDALHQAVCKALSQMIEKLLANCPEKKVLRAAVVGNPTMLHLLCGISPAGIGHYPFTPAFLSLREYRGPALGIPADCIQILPAISAFIGSDISAGVQFTQMEKSDFPSVLMDIGTNGEMVLCTGQSGNRPLLGTSAAAGPALEGAGISCGVGGIPGAICAVTRQNGADHFRTIGDAAPIGLCGSGFIDLIAQLLLRGIIDSSGNMRENYPIARRTDGSLIELLPKDIRAFQLAKSAIRAGFEVLLESGGISVDQIGTIYLAGGLGFFMNPRSAAIVGLIPPILAKRTKAVGNSALDGAIECLCHPEQIDQLNHIVHRCTTISLNDFPSFQQQLLNHLAFSGN